MSEHSLVESLEVIAERTLQNLSHHAYIPNLFIQCKYCPLFIVRGVSDIYSGLVLGALNLYSELPGLKSTLKINIMKCLILAYNDNQSPERCLWYLKYTSDNGHVEHNIGGMNQPLSQTFREPLK
jgi:hypothetical protein